MNGIRPMFDRRENKMQDTSKHRLCDTTKAA